MNDDNKDTLSTELKLTVHLVHASGRNESEKYNLTMRLLPRFVRIRNAVSCEFNLTRTHIYDEATSVLNSLCGWRALG